VVERTGSDRRLEAAREAERSRMARDMHDEALSELADAIVDAQLAKSAAVDAVTAGRLERLVPTLSRIGQQLRAAIYDSRLPEEQHRPFPELLESLVELHRVRAVGFEIELELQRDGVGPLGPQGTQLLRIVGEALTNARRHSASKKIRVTFRAAEGKVTVEVSDDGLGFDAPALRHSDGTGIRGMQERAAIAGAALDIESRPGEGTLVRVDLPLGSAYDSGERLRVLLVDDHASVRQAIANAFRSEDDFEVVAEVGSLKEARQMLEQIDVAIIDLALPDGYGGDLITELRERNPDAQALVLTASPDRAEVARAVESGAGAVVSKAASLEEVVTDVRRLRAGETLLPPEQAMELLRFAGRQREREHEDRRALAALTARERQVLQALADGLDSNQIAGRLHIAIRTEQNHVANILAKLGVHSRLQALVFALRYGVVEIR
jgi:DNA-binding NarL/FixJ family response regulator